MFKTSFDYDSRGQSYSAVRQTDPHIAGLILGALGDSKTVLNVGAGAGSYEPGDRFVVAVEPSASMRSQRIANGRNPAVNAKAGELPFDNDSFDAVMALLTVHHWPDLRKGLDEMKRVTGDRVLIMTYDPDSLDVFWNADYFPELVEVERSRYPKLQTITEHLGGNCGIISLPVPLDCKDGFQEAFYGRPEEFLRSEVRISQSAWSFLDEETHRACVDRLADALASGEWDRKHGHHRKLPFFNGALRLIVYHKA